MLDIFKSISGTWFSPEVKNV